MKCEYPNPLVFQRADPFIYRHTDGYSAALVRWPDLMKRSPLSPGIIMQKVR